MTLLLGLATMSVAMTAREPMITVASYDFGKDRGMAYLDVSGR